MGKFICNNKEFLVKGNIIKINFEFLLIEVKKLIACISIKSKHLPSKPLYINREDVRGDEVPVKDLNGNRLNFPTDPIFTWDNVRTNNQHNSVQVNNTIRMSRQEFGKVYNKEFSNLKNFVKLNEPLLYNTSDVYNLSVLSANLNLLTSDLGHFPKVLMVTRFLDRIFTAHPAHHNYHRRGFGINGALYFEMNHKDRECLVFAHITVVEKTWGETVKKLHELATGANLHPDQNKFLVNISPNHMTFFIYQKNIMQHYPLKQGYAKDLVCIVLGPNGVVPAPQTNDARLIAIPYNINHNPCSILAILNYMATCPKAPILLIGNRGAVEIQTPDPMPSIRDQVKSLDAFNTIGNNGQIVPYY